MRTTFRISFNNLFCSVVYLGVEIGVSLDERLHYGLVARLAGYDQVRVPSPVLYTGESFSNHFPEHLLTRGNCNFV
jgi:hypothetical protein